MAAFSLHKLFRLRIYLTSAADSPLSKYAVFGNLFRNLISFWLKIVAFFYNLAVAIGVANGAMLTFNASVRKNLLIGGAVIVISQLDRIIEVIKSNY